ncbi:hypothetical protein SDC9_115732 [bioreactor metagenome]|uniref:Uncharacterized protein n=1 Tax=bioreactor metagenome TaxID=1076179 RepID=A0A645BUP7_9ZZZZ
MSTFFTFSLTYFNTSTFLSHSEKSTSIFSILPVLAISLSSFFITPGLTVLICGLWFGHIIVAIIFPPNAGLVINNPWFSSSISRDVQSAVSPVPIVALTLGAKSLPIVVAPTKTISGSFLFITSVRALVYVLVKYTSKFLSSTQTTSSAPYCISSSLKSSILWPNNTALNLLFILSANSLPFPNNSKETFCNSPLLCSTKTITLIVFPPINYYFS